jgi:predicted dehydrogenase
MNTVVVGLGSMGKRRVRCLQALGDHVITGIDPRADRRKEAQETYGIVTVPAIKAVDATACDALVISTPPHLHLRYIQFAIDNRIPCFVEASVVLRGLPEARRRADRRKVLVAPSCTMRFHKAIRNIKQAVEGKKYGKVSNFSYHCGQFLPDWHPWERVADFYVSRKETGGAREIVPFELTWLVDVFGLPAAIQGYRAKTINVGAPIDDSYAVAMKFPGAVGTMVIDVTSRFATRSLILNMEKGQVVWNWEDEFISVYDAQTQEWTKIQHQMVGAAQGYNKNISEEMYIDEVAAFLQAIRRPKAFPNTLKDDIRVLEMLHKVEKGQRR